MSVWLGLCGEAVKPTADDCGWWTNKLGGSPDWIAQEPELSLLKCDLCGSLLALVAQVYAPLEGAAYHRTLHLLACTRRSCWNRSAGWQVLRSQQLDDSSKSSASTSAEVLSGSGCTVWGDGQDDWGDGGDDWGDGGAAAADFFSAGPCLTTQPAEVSSSANATQAMASDISKPPTSPSSDAQPSSAPFSLPSVFRPFYVDVVEEASIREDSASLSRERKLAAEYERREKVTFSSLDEEPTSRGGRESYEKITQHGDVAFHRFHKCLRACPQQLMRYKWKGSPLGISDRYPLTSAPLCHHCGSECVFELQLMPPLISLLRPHTRTIASDTKGACTTAAEDKTKHMEGDKQVDLGDSEVYRDQSADQGHRNRTGDSHRDREDSSDDDDDGVPPTDIDLEEVAAVAKKLQEQCAETGDAKPGVEFGTVLVFSCSRSCWKDQENTFLTENLFVFPDPDLSSLQRLGLS